MTMRKTMSPSRMMAAPTAQVETKKARKKEKSKVRMMTTTRTWRTISTTASTMMSSKRFKRKTRVSISQLQLAGLAVELGRLQSRKSDY